MTALLLKKILDRAKQLYESGIEEGEDNPSKGNAYINKAAALYDYTLAVEQGIAILRGDILTLTTAQIRAEIKGKIKTPGEVLGYGPKFFSICVGYKAFHETDKNGDSHEEIYPQYKERVLFPEGFGPIPGHNYAEVPLQWLSPRKIGVPPCMAIDKSSPMQLDPDNVRGKQVKAKQQQVTTFSFGYQPSSNRIASAGSGM